MAESDMTAAVFVGAGGSEWTCVMIAPTGNCSSTYQLVPMPTSLSAQHALYVLQVYCVLITAVLHTSSYLLAFSVPGRVNGPAMMLS